MAAALTQEQAAAVVGVTARAMRKVDQDGTGPPRDEHGGYPPEKLGEWMRERGSRNSAEARLTSARAEKAEMEVAAMRKSLVPVADVSRFWQRLAGSMRARLLTLPPSLAPIVIGMSAREAQAEIQRAVNEALTEIANDGVPPDSGKGSTADVPSAA